MSSETKWTPGPWSVGVEGDGVPGYVYCDNDLGSAVAICYGPALAYTVFPREQEVANAQLIAASPKLYEALAAQLKWFEAHHAILLELGNPDFVAMRDQARTALASARGEG